jgi:hypothetical protein
MEEVIKKSIMATNFRFEYWHDIIYNRTLVLVDEMPENKPIYGLFWYEVKEE